MRKTAVVLLVGAGLLAWSFLSKANVINALKILIQRIKVEFSGLSPVITLVVLVQNPTSDKFTVYSLAGDVFVNNNYIGNVSMFTKTEIIGNSQTEIPLTIKLSIVSMISNIVDIVTGKSAGGGGVVGLSGTINIDNASIPVNIAYKII